MCLRTFVLRTFEIAWGLVSALQISPTLPVGARFLSECKRLQLLGTAETGNVDLYEVPDFTSISHIVLAFLGCPSSSKNKIKVDKFDLKDAAAIFLPLP